MGKTHHVIYIPGIGDHKPEIQIKLLSRWNKPDFQVHFFRLVWNDDEKFSSKLARLTKIIDELYEENGQVSLVGVSAGAGAALNAYIERPEKISGVVYICGKIIGLKNVGQAYFEKNPPFFDSLELTQNNLQKLSAQDKAKMLSLKPIFDETVPVNVTKIPGVASRTLFSLFHVPSIFLALTIYKPMSVNFLKDRAGIQ
ncbi:alpha/beta hydrolase [Candidatus Saccharibacteria bacterium]|nr:alpha/beta hydrolase [Candidatus Saccharibacteria bacterium]